MVPYYNKTQHTMARLQRGWAVTRNTKYPIHSDQDLGLLTVFSIWYPGYQCLLMVNMLGLAVAANCGGLKLANPRVVGSEWVAGFR